MSTAVNLDNTIKRLRKTKVDSDQRSYQKGVERGLTWARDSADYTELVFYLHMIERARADSKRVSNLGDLPVLEGVELEVEETRMRCHCVKLDRERYIEGFFDGVEDLWNQVADHLN